MDQSFDAEIEEIFRSIKSLELPDSDTDMDSWMESNDDLISKLRLPNANIFFNSAMEGLLYALPVGAAGIFNGTFDQSTIAAYLLTCGIITTVSYHHSKSIFIKYISSAYRFLSEMDIQDMYFSSETDMLLAIRRVAYKLQTKM